MKISEVMCDRVRSARPTEAIAEAAQAMAEEDVGTLPVVDDGRLVGIVTDRDLALRGLADGLHGGAPVLRVMTPEVVICRPDDEIEDVLEIMAEQQIRRVPVCGTGGELLGMFSIADAARRDPDKDKVGEALAEISQPHGRHCQSISA